MVQEDCYTLPSSCCPDPGETPIGGLFEAQGTEVGDECSTKVYSALYGNRWEKGERVVVKRNRKEEKRKEEGWVTSGGRGRSENE